MGRVLQQVPVQAVLVRPFPPLAELPAHEKQLLPGLGVHVAEEQPQVGELLPVVAGHLAQQRALAVDDLVMGEGQDEILGEGVEHAEGQVVLVVLAVDRVFADV